MSEIRVGSWNALNSFGDERADDALEVVRHMDADVLFLCEMTARDDLKGENFLAVSERLRTDLGYTKHVATDYSPYLDARNVHTMALWTRDSVATDKPSRVLYGERYGTRLHIPTLGATVFGLHLDDASPQERLVSTEAVINNWHDCGVEAIVLGDLNEMHRHDFRSRLPQMVGKVAGRLEVKDYYDTSRRLQRFAGKVTRLCSMADGQALSNLEAAGLHDADPESQPTIGRQPLAFQLDHILLSSGLEWHDFQRHPRKATPDRANLSDHSPISVDINLWQ